MTQNQDTISAAIKAAQTVAAAVPMQTAPAAQAMTSTLPAGRVRTLDDAMAAVGAAVDMWASIEPDSYRFGKSKPVDQIVGTLTMSEIQTPFGVRFNVGGSTRFSRSYDGIREAQSGKPWMEVVAQAQQMDGNCKGQYDLAEIPIVLTADLVTSEKTYKAGTRIGITTPVTGFKPFMAWVRETRLTHSVDEVLAVCATVERKEKAGVKDWGIPVLTLLAA